MMSLTPLHLLISHDVNTPSSTSAFTAAMRTPPGLRPRWFIHFVFSSVRVITYSSKHFNILVSLHQNHNFAVFLNISKLPFCKIWKHIWSRLFHKRLISAEVEEAKPHVEFLSRQRRNGRWRDAEHLTGGQSAALQMTENTLLCQMKI